MRLTNEADGRVPGRLHLASALVVMLLAAACTTDGSGSPTPDAPAGSGGGTSATAEPQSADAVIEKVPAAQWARMTEVGMWRPGCPATRSDLRRVEVNHHRFDGTIGRGVLVVNRDVAPVVAEIFTELFDAEFPIRKMQPVERYDGDANASLAADNTSAYNCRRPDQINAPPMDSPHANGRAIDINPRENPWMDLRCDCWFPTAATAKRKPGPGKILKGGLVWRLFTERGWVWQNIDVPDYMHFDTGYPSRPYERP